jgi:hypothetical protein
MVQPLEMFDIGRHQSQHQRRDSGIQEALDEGHALGRIAKSAPTIDVVAGIERL